MAIYHLSAQVISRSAGRSAVAAAAYRAAERLVDERTGLAHDFTRRRGEIERKIRAPVGAPDWVLQRCQLWNRVEAAEKRKDAQVCREINVALPRELSDEQQRQVLRGYVHEQFVQRGMVAEIAIHRDAQNPHAHAVYNRLPEAEQRQVAAQQTLQVLTGALNALRHLLDQRRGPSRTARRRGKEIEQGYDRGR